MRLGLPTSAWDVFKLTALLSLPFNFFFFFFPESRQWGLYAGLFLGGIVGIIMILQVVILLLRRRGRCLTREILIRLPVVSRGALPTSTCSHQFGFLQETSAFAKTLNKHILRPCLIQPHSTCLA